MRHIRRYKYFSNIDYALEFLNGYAYHNTLAYFRDYEDAVIGDEFESTRTYQPEGGLQINDLTHKKSFPLQMSFESSVRAAEIYILCLSLIFTDEVVRKFQAKAYIEIREPAIFIKRWLSALPKDAESFNRKVDYYRPEHGPGNIWPQPHLIASTKLVNFAYQQEYRLGFSVTGALAFGQASQQLIDPKTRPAPKPEEHHHWVLELGDLHDISTLYDMHT
jgi:hypothetical protein